MNTKYKKYADRKQYTEAEIQYLTENFYKKTSIEVAEALGRSPASIRNYWIKLGLRRKEVNTVRKPAKITEKEKIKASLVALKIANKLGMSLKDLNNLTLKVFQNEKRQTP